MKNSILDGQIHFIVFVGLYSLDKWTD